MARGKKNNILLYLILGLAAYLFFFTNIGRENVIEDNYLYYDDFNVPIAAGPTYESQAEGLTGDAYLLALKYNKVATFSPDSNPNICYNWLNPRNVPLQYCLDVTTTSCPIAEDGRYTTWCKYDYGVDRGGNAEQLWEVDNYDVKQYCAGGPGQPLQIIDGKLFLDDRSLGGQLARESCYKEGDGVILSGPSRKNKITSTKEFTTDDIKIRLKAMEYEVGYPPQRYPTEIYFGEFRIPLFDDIPWERIIVQHEADDQRRDWDGLLEIKRYDDLDLSKFVVLRDGIEIATGVQPGPAKISFQGRDMYIDYVKYQPYYSCEVDPSTEVVVRDKYDGGQTINIEDLTYTPTKFCPQDLGVLIFSDEGFTDEKGSITQKLAEGENLDIPSDQYWQIDYVTKYVTDMTERCGVGEAYDTFIRKCVSVAGQEIPTPTLLYCEQSSDCILPAKCDDAIVSCDNNQCNYASIQCTPEQIINEVLVEKTVVLKEPVIIEIKTDGNQFPVTTNAEKTSMQVAERAFYISKPRFLCGGSTDRGYNTDQTCYEADVTWGDFSFTIKGGEKYQTTYVDFEYQMTGRGVYYGNRTKTVDGEPQITFYNNTFREEEDWSNTVTVTAKGLLDIIDLNYQEAQELNGDGKLSLTIRNNLWDLDQSGYYLRVNKELRDIQTEFTPKKLPYDYGVNTERLDLPNDELGVYVVEIAPYIEFVPGEEFLFKQLSIGYYVATDLPGDEIAVAGCESDSDCYVGQCENKICYVTIRETTTDTVNTEGTGENALKGLTIGGDESDFSPITILVILAAVVGVILIYTEAKKKPKKRRRRKK